MTMRKDVLEEILSCPSLPSLPAVAVRVIELTSDPNVKLADIGRVVEADQGLTTKILRTVNSSFYGLRQKCGSIQKALVMLGLNPVKSLALSFSLVKAVEDGHEGCTFDFTSYWRRGLYTAVAARVLGGIVRLDDPDEAFLGGLLQDVGMVAMHRALGARYDEVLRSASHHRDLVPLELSAFELQHPDVGAMLAERWKLPAQIVLPVRYHERPTAAPAICIPMIRCVAIGNIAHDVLTDADPTDAMRRLYARGEQWFDLKQEQVDEILHRISVGVREMSSVLRLSTGQVADVDEVLKKANERLVELTRADTNRVVNDESRPKMDLYEKDPTTGLGTPAAFQTAMRAAFDAGEQKGEAVSVIQVRVTQTSPTGTGSDATETLLGVATLLIKHFLPLGGIVCRTGDLTFGIVVIGTGRLPAQRVAEEFRIDLEQTGARWAKHGGMAVTASIGVVGIEQNTDSPFSRPEQLAAATTRAIQACESAGGNCVRVFVPKAA
ncbi:MAG: HDOD domain-containing protein [Phycisphaeraceae bacterium]|nr:MAG: HDOD domain-containing protein [Phycisphaeraceae bacterium]